MAVRFEGQGPPDLDNASQAVLAENHLHYSCYIGDGHMLDTLIGRALLFNQDNREAMDACAAVLVSEEDSLNGWTPAHYAAFFGQLHCLMKLHVRSNLGFDTPSQRSNVSPLHLAAKSGAVLCLKWLLQCGASKNRQDFMGETPLHKAAKSGNADCAAMLVGHGASLSMKNYRGLTPADLGEQSNHSALAQYLRRAAEQAEYGSTTACINQSSLPISDLSSVVPPRDSQNYMDLYRPDTLKENGNILMNGERIHHLEDNVMDADMDMDEGAMDNRPFNSNNNHASNTAQNNLSIGWSCLNKKRSIDECDEFEQFNKKRCTDALREKASTNILLKPSDPMPQSSLLEHHASVLAQQGYDSSFMATMANAFH